MTGHEYGPHNPDHHPTVVLVGNDSDPACPEHYEPIHPDVLRQWEQMNTIAHEASKASR